MDGATPGTIGGTFLGNPVCCAAALATIAFMESENLNERAMEISRIVEKKFTEMKALNPSIGDIRGLGAMQAIEFIKENDPAQPDTELVSKLVAACLDRGLLLISAGTNGNVIRLLSPLVIDNKTLLKGINIIEEELQKLNK